jgi:A/G-specific adenine glycosylase
LNSRDLPWRKTKDPYKIWICEIVLQQTRVEQGKNHYLRFIERFPDAKTLAEAETDEVLLYWKGLGYYSRAINLHKAAQQVMAEFEGVFPSGFQEIQKLKGVGKYTAAAIASICFNEKVPAVDGNFYRVLSRVFADDFDISSSKAHAYFYELALRIMPEKEPGNFNQAIMDLGSEVCKPKNPSCETCPLNENCLAYGSGSVSAFPVKTKKVKAENLKLQYYFVQHENLFLIKQRDESFIWKKLYDFPEDIPVEFQKYIAGEKTIHHKLTHKNLEINIVKILVSSKKCLENFAQEHYFMVTDYEKSHQKSFPKPLENYLKKAFES